MPDLKIWKATRRYKHSLCDIFCITDMSYVLPTLPRPQSTNIRPPIWDSLYKSESLKSYVCHEFWRIPHKVKVRGWLEIFPIHATHEKDFCLPFYSKWNLDIVQFRLIFFRSFILLSHCDSLSTSFSLSLSLHPSCVLAVN